MPGNLRYVPVVTRIFRFRNQASLLWSWSRRWALTLSPKPATFLNLLLATAAFTASLPHSYSSTFAPLIQCSTWFPLTRIRDWLISPGGLVGTGAVGLRTS